MSSRNKHSSAAKLLEVVSSSKLALVLVFLIILFSIIGAVLPQEGTLRIVEIRQWQQVHPWMTTVLGPLGFFHLFHSWPFLFVILLLGLNTLTCTLWRFVKEGGLTSLSGPRAFRQTGFLLLHLSLITLLAGGFLSAAASFDGYILLTEGQGFTGRPESYLRRVQGPLHSDRWLKFSVRLEKVLTKYEKKRYLVDVASTLEVLEQNRLVTSAVLRINQPFSHKGLAFTQDKTGFSPRLRILDKKSGRQLLNSFVALQTFDTPDGRNYRDYLPLPIFDSRFIVTVYPNFGMKNGRAIKVGDEPDNPLLIIETEDRSGQTALLKQVRLGEKIAIGDHIVSFEELRRWSAFRVVRDPGYFIVCVSLWLGLGALLLRYIPDLRKWFG